MHHVFLAPILTPSDTSTSTACPRLAFIDINPAPESSLTDKRYSQSLDQRVKRSGYHDQNISPAAHRTASQRPHELNLSTVAEGSEADISWSVSRIHPHAERGFEPEPQPSSIPPATGIPGTSQGAVALSAAPASNKRQKCQHKPTAFGPALPVPPTTRLTRRPSAAFLTDRPERSEDSIAIGPTPSYMRDLVDPGPAGEASGQSQTDEVGSLPGHFVRASELVRRAIGPRRSSRLRLSEGTTTATIDLPDSLMSLNTTTTLTPPSQSSTPALPTWTVPLARLKPLQSVMGPGTGTNASTRGGSTSKHSVIVCVVSTEPVVQRQRKEEKSRGQEGSLWISSWKVVAPPAVATNVRKGQEAEEASCGVKLWNEVAREWDGKVRRGDVVLLENYKPATTHEPAHLSISTPSFRTAASPKVTILYRTLPQLQRQAAVASASDYLPPHLRVLRYQAHDEGAIVSEDKALRSDLRLERSDMGIRKVREVADWFARWVGGEGPPVL